MGCPRLDVLLAIFHGWGHWVRRRQEGERQEAEGGGSNGGDGDGWGEPWG